MKKQVVIIGLGRLGESLAFTLTGMGYDVLALDKDGEIIQNIAPKVAHAAQVDATNELALRQLGVSNMEVAIVTLGDDIQASVLITLLLKTLGLPQVIARAKNELHGRILEKIGAHNVIYPEKETGERVAHSLSFPYVLDYIDLVGGYGISKIAPLPHFLGQTLEDLDMVPKTRGGITVLVIARGKEIIINPDRFERIQAGDILTLVAKDEDLAHLRLPGRLPVP